MKIQTNLYRLLTLSLIVASALSTSVAHAMLSGDEDAVARRQAALRDLHNLEKKSRDLIFQVRQRKDKEKEEAAQQALQREKADAALMRSVPPAQQNAGTSAMPMPMPVVQPTPYPMPMAFSQFPQPMAPNFQQYAPQYQQQQLYPPLPAFMVSAAAPMQQQQPPYQPQLLPQFPQQAQHQPVFTTPAATPMQQQPPYQPQLLPQFPQQAQHQPVFTTPAATPMQQQPVLVPPAPARPLPVFTAPTVAPMQQQQPQYAPQPQYQQPVFTPSPAPMQKQPVLVPPAPQPPLAVFTAPPVIEPHAKPANMDLSASTTPHGAQPVDITASMAASVASRSRSAAGDIDMFQQGLPRPRTGVIVRTLVVKDGYALLGQRTLSETQLRSTFATPFGQNVSASSIYNIALKTLSDQTGGKIAIAQEPGVSATHAISHVPRVLTEEIIEQDGQVGIQQYVMFFVSLDGLYHIDTKIPKNEIFDRWTGVSLENLLSVATSDAAKKVRDATRKKITLSKSGFLNSVRNNPTVAAILQVLRQNPGIAKPMLASPAPSASSRAAISDVITTSTSATPALEPRYQPGSVPVGQIGVVLPANFELLEPTRARTNDGRK